MQLLPGIDHDAIDCPGHPTQTLSLRARSGVVSEKRQVQVESRTTRYLDVFKLSPKLETRTGKSHWAGTLAILSMNGITYK